MTDDVMAGEELGQKLLESVRQMKRGDAARVTHVEVSEAVEARDRVGLSQNDFATEMHAARGRGESLSDWDALRRNAVAGVAPADDPDAPDVTALMRQEVARRRVGRPPGTGTKEPVAIRLDKEIVTAFRATGAGWQSRVNAALRDWLKDHTPA